MSEHKWYFSSERWANVGLMFVLIVTVWAAFETAQVNNRLDQTVKCLTQYNTNQGEALDSRDAAIRAETKAEIDLWSLYEELYEEASDETPPPSEERLKQLQDKLARAIVEYRDKLIDTQKNREVFPYRDPDILQDCKEQ